MTKVIELISSNIDQTMESPLLVVDFYADWCGPCKQMDPIIEDAAESEFGGAQYAKVNAGSDEMREFTELFGIRNIPTYIIFKAGEEVARKTGAMPASQFKKFVSESV